jgi:hypothetical protein
MQQQLSFCIGGADLWLQPVICVLTLLPSSASRSELACQMQSKTGKSPCPALFVQFLPVLALVMHGV